MNIQDFIKAKEEELRAIYLKSGKDILGGNLPFRIMSEDEICNFLSQSLLEYNEKIKEMIELEKVNSDYGVFVGEEKADIIYNQALDDIITNLTQDTNPKE